MLTRSELPALIDSLGGDPTSVSLYGAHEDGVVIDNRTTGWVVFIADRGKEYELRTHASEDDACRDVLQRLGLRLPDAP